MTNAGYIEADGGLVLNQIPFTGRATTAISGTIGLSGATLIFFSGSWRKVTDAAA